MNTLAEQLQLAMQENENLRRANLDCVDMFNQIRDDYDKAVAENKELRRFICVRLADRPYMDDGEASDGSVYPFIDYLRDSVEDIRSKLNERNLKNTELDEAGNPIITYKITRSRS